MKGKEVKWVECPDCCGNGMEFDYSPCPTCEDNGLVIRGTKSWIETILFGDGKL